LDTENTIEVKELTKRFDEVVAVDRISFEVKRDEIYGFLGPNGAGKTTTIRILTGLARPNSGTIHIENIDGTHNPKAAQHLIGVVPDESNLYHELTGFENLCFCASLYGVGKSERITEATELLETFGLTQAASRKFGGYSKGMKRKLTIAAGIIHKPKILFLDEPTTGIDVASARRIRQIIADLREFGTTVFLTTHYIEEAERLCDRIAFIVSGIIVRIDSVENLIQPIQEKQIVEISYQKSKSDIQEKLKDTFSEYSFQFLSKNIVRIETSDSINVGALVRFIEDESAEVIEARRFRPTLEDIFVQITGIEVDAMRKDREKAGGAV